MAAGVKFVPDKGFLSELLTSPGVQDAVRDKGRRALSAAIGSAPVKSGDYLASLHLVVGVDGDRAKARVGSTDPGAIPIEQRHHTLRNALGAL